MAARDVPLCRPDVGKAELDAVARTFANGALAHGPEVRAFEEALAKRVGVRHAVAFNSCTSALFLLCSHIREEKGAGEIIVPSFTFVASANAVACAGMTPRFVDVEWATGNVSAAQIEPAINSGTRAVMAVHYAGRPCRMREIMELAGRRSLAVVEDCAECLGPSVDGKAAGSFDRGAFSFYATKNITTGEGGAVTTDDGRLAEWLRLRVAHGVAKGSYARGGVSRKWHRNAVVAGYNFRLSNFQAAMGLAQLARLDEMNARRFAVAKEYAAAFRDMKGIECPELLPPDRHSYQMYPVKVAEDIRDEVLNKLNADGVGASAHFDPPAHLQTAYRSEGFALPVTERLARSTITLPISSVQELVQTRYVIDRLRRAF